MRETIGRGMKLFQNNLSDSCVENELEGGETRGRVGWVAACVLGTIWCSVNEANVEQTD